ncbi:MAG: PqqD family protein [Candidatus Omnitrophica bacterium]|nr:PqqD family protein [Candidatus Omnitrophota bacterium]
MPIKPKPDDILRPSKDFLGLEVDGVFVIASLIHGKEYKQDEVFELDDISKRIWQLLDGRRSLKEIAGMLSSDFGISHNELQEDILELTEKFLEKDLLIKAIE